MGGVFSRFYRNYNLSGAGIRLAHRTGADKGGRVGKDAGGSSELDCTAYDARGVDSVDRDRTRSANEFPYFPLHHSLPHEKCSDTHDARSRTGHAQLLPYDGDDQGQPNHERYDSGRTGIHGARSRSKVEGALGSEGELDQCDYNRVQQATGFRLD